MTARRLAAILAADVVGSSRLIEADEAYALATIREVLHDTLIATAAQHGGRLIKTMGDGALIEFASPIAAVTCAAAVQRAVAKRAAMGPEDRRVLLRIGINLGDVVAQSDGDLYGDGVNIAARLEATADPGGIAISAKVYDELQGKLSVPFVDRGELRLKNIARPVRVYAVGDGQPARSQSVALPLPDKPSIAVLPFSNMSGDPEQEYFADGVVEDVITALSHFPRLFVVARNSTFTYKGRAVDIRTVGRELGVRYVLEGSVRKSGQRLRITGQLIDADTGAHLWADRFEGVLEEVFEFQDEVTRSVVGAITPRVTAAEIDRSQRKRPENLDTYDLYLRALPAVREMTREANDRALLLVSRALEIDPHYAVMAALGAWAYTLRVAQNWQSEPEAEKRRALDLARLAIAKGQDDADAMSMAGYALGFLGEQLREGLAAVERAISLNPNSALAYANSGWLKAYLGRAEEAIADFERSVRLSPREPNLFRTDAGLCFALRRRAHDRNPNFAPGHRALASALGHLGRLDEAQQVVEELLQLVPGLTVAAFAKHSLFRYSGRLEIILEGLRRAGLPP